MTFKTTNTSDFNLDLNSCIEESFERCGAELRSGYDMRTAKRSLSLMLLEWANRGINLWTLEQGQITLSYQQATYDLPITIVDLLDHVIRTQAGTAQQIDINITRISSSTYLSIPNKTATGRPIQVWINRQSGATNADGSIQHPQINVWPTPDNSTQYIFVYTALRRLYDAGTGINGQDIPFRFLPVLVAGLSYYLSMKLPGAEVRTPALKAVYEEEWQRAAEEDRERAAIRFVPRETFIGYR